MPTLPYLVVVRATRYDEFVARRLAASGTVCLVLDETAAPQGQVPHAPTLRCTETLLRTPGLPQGPDGRFFVYNVDYYLYHAAAAYPDYAYYLLMDFDSVAQCDLDALVARAASENMDYVGQPIATDIEQWMWLASCRGAYPAPERIEAHMLYVALFSRRAVSVLRSRRLAQAERFLGGTLGDWPTAEGFVPTEARLAGLNTAPLSDYGAVPRVSWWPPYHERQLPGLAADAFVHPVATGTPYLRAMLRGGVPAALKAWWLMATSKRVPKPV